MKSEGTTSLPGGVASPPLSRMLLEDNLDLSFIVQEDFELGLYEKSLALVGRIVVRCEKDNPDLLQCWQKGEVVFLAFCVRRNRGFGGDV